MPYEIVKKQFSAFCPETGQNQTIEIKFKKITMCGNPIPGYVATNYRCQHYLENRCASCGADGRDCPVLQAGELSMNQGNIR